ncbi:ZIP family metal transporter [Candidatus Woesearchaeota archaeon]|nr:ZIP family metal transporter [Candidatus Woesearchaeota archaeon]
MEFAYPLVSVLAVSLVSFVGAFALFSKRRDNLLFLLVSLSAGTLVGGGLLHLIPEAVEVYGEFSVQLSLLVIAGIVVFFLLDHVIHWHHSHSDSLVHQVKTGNRKRIAYLNLIGDGLHNFIDGLVIAGSYIISLETGIAVTIGIIVHETPQEIADFGVLLYSGFSRTKALLLNFGSACLAIVGTIAGLMFASRSVIFLKLILPFAGGAFLYIACSTMIPEIFHHRTNLKKSAASFLFMIVGVAIMYGLIFLE